MTSIRTTPQLRDMMEGIKQSSSFNASWDRAKKKSLQEIYSKVTPREASALAVDPYFLDRNDSISRPKINYEKFKAKRGHHRARHNLKVAHEFFQNEKKDSPVLRRHLKNSGQNLIFHVLS